MSAPSTGEDWRQQAVCSAPGVDVDLPWTDAQRMLRLCRACPVLRDCARDALATEPDDWQWRHAGVRAGMTAWARRHDRSALEAAAT